MTRCSRPQQELHAGAGNETLSGAFGSGADSYFGSAGSTQMIGGIGSSTFVAVTGAATVTAGFGGNLFTFINSQAGGTERILDFTSGPDQVDLQGYGKDEVANALKSQHVVSGADIVTLSDNTTISFVGIANVTASDFVTSGGSAFGGGNDDGDNSGNGHGSQDHPNMDDHSHLRDMPIGHS